MALGEPCFGEDDGFSCGNTGGDENGDTSLEGNCSLRNWNEFEEGV